MNPGGSGFYWDSANPTPVIEFAVSSSTVTISTSGVCKVLFPKQGTNGLMQELDLSGRSYSCNFSTYPNSALCGITEANWASAMPWFVYLVNTNNTAAGVYACITRNPKMSVTPAAAEINDTEAVSASQVQTTINSFTTHDNSTAAVPCICIGSLTMTYATATKKWTPGALASTDGFGKFQEGVQFDMPVGQNGAGASNLFSSAGTTPTYTDVLEAIYTISVDGIMWYQVFGKNITGGTAGNGASILYAHTPYTISSSFGRYHGVGVMLNNATYYNCVAACESSSKMYLFSDTLNANISCTNQNNDVRRYYATIRAPVF